MGATKVRNIKETFDDVSTYPVVYLINNFMVCLQVVELNFKIRRGLNICEDHCVQVHSPLIAMNG